MTRAARGVPAAVLGVAAVLAALLVIAAAEGADRPSGDAPIGGVLRDADRAALGAVPVERGADAPVDPGVDFTDPEAVARAYLAAAHSVQPQDAGRTQRRAAGYAVPGGAEANTGVLVLDPPPPGALRTTTVTGLALDAADRPGLRVRYRADLGTATGPAAGPVAVALTHVHVVLARRPDGRWLVAAETADRPDRPAGDD